jgi:predicted phage-related endonuclease
MTAPAPGTPEWARLVTASKVAAILGLSPWESPFSMWHKMKGLIPSDDGSNADAKSRGHYLEDGIVRWWIDQHPDADVEGAQLYAERDGWAGSTPDVVATLTESRERVVVDAKTAAFGDEWGDEPPAYYQAQMVWQMWTHDADAGYVAALLGPRLTLREFRVERDRDLEAAIVARCRAFYDSLAHDTPPPLDDTTATYEAVRALHPDIDRDLSVEIDRRTAHEYVAASLALKEAEKRERAAKARLLDVMGRARLSTCDGATVARRQPRGEAVSLVRVAKYISPPPPEEKSA